MSLSIFSEFEVLPLLDGSHIIVLETPSTSNHSHVSRFHVHSSCHCYTRAHNYHYSLFLKLIKLGCLLAHDGEFTALSVPLAWTLALYECEGRHTDPSPFRPLLPSLHESGERSHLSPAVLRPRDFRGAPAVPGEEDRPHQAQEPPMWGPPPRNELTWLVDAVRVLVISWNLGNAMPSALAAQVVDRWSV